MKVVPASSKMVTVGFKSWAALVEESSRDTTVPSNAKTLDEIMAELKEAGLPFGKGYALKYVRETVKRGAATEHRVLRGGRWSKVYAIKGAK